jgi:hypothetical protein
VTSVPSRKMTPATTFGNWFSPFSRRLAHAVRARWPNIQIIVCSGCDPLEAALLPEEAHFIAKPCAEKLVRKALQALQLH